MLSLAGEGHAPGLPASTGEGPDANPGKTSKRAPPVRTVLPVARTDGIVCDAVRLLPGLDGFALTVNVPLPPWGIAALACGVSFLSRQDRRVCFVRERLHH